MSTDKFACESCYLLFRAQSSFWLGYKAICPRCGAECEVFAEERASPAFGGMDVDAPLFESDERTEGDIEGERDIIREEIAEALAAAEVDANDAELGSEADGESDAEGNGSAGSA